MNPIIEKLLKSDPAQRKAILSSLDPNELAVVFAELESIENTPQRRWYCPRETCNGEPHAGFHWCEHPIDGEHTPYCKHARTPQRPPNPDDPWLVWFFSGGRGTGKLLALDTPIPTPFGWTTMGKLKVGDVVFDEAGRLCNVTATYDEMPERAYTLRFSDGTSIVAGGEHQWVTWTHAERKSYLRSGGHALPNNWPTWRSPSGIGPQIRTTDEIAATSTFGKRGDTNHSISVAGSLCIPDAELPIDPYILGCWLGDGSSAAAEITCHDDDAPFCAEQFSALGEGFFLSRRRHDDKPTGTYTIGKREPQRGVDGRMEANGSITSRLRSLELLNNKHVPVKYLWASQSQRLALLQGLMDTDGGWSAKTVEFCSTNQELANAVVFLARSLGQKPVIKEGRAKMYGQDCGPKWRVTWRPTVQVFRLPRKAERLNCETTQFHRHTHRMIVKVESFTPEPMRCITVDSLNSMYLAGEGMIPTHNTRAGSEWVLDLVWNRGFKRIALVGRTPADVRDVMIYGDSGIMAVSDPNPRPQHEPTKRRLVWPNGAQAFTYSAAAPSQLRGPQHDAAWCDELAAWSDARKGDTLDTSWNNLMLGLRLGKNPKCLVTTTPKRVKLVQEIMGRLSTVITNGTTFDNLENLSPSFRESVLAAYEGTRIGRQELMGEMMVDVDGSMWNLGMIDESRVIWQPMAPLPEEVPA